MSCTDVQTTKPGNGSKKQFSFDFPYLFKTEIEVSFWNATTKEWDVILNDGLLADDTNWMGNADTYPWKITDANPTIVEFTGTAPPATSEVGVDNVRIRRVTNIDDIRALFSPGSAIRSDDLNKNFEQLRYAIQEAFCQNVPEEIEKYIDDYYWNNYADTVKSSDGWDSSDTKIATTAAMDARYLDQGTDTISEEEQDKSSPAPSDVNVFSALAAARRFDAIVNTANPGLNPDSDTDRDWETGKLWYQNDEDKTVHMWDGSKWDPITSGGAFTRLDQVIYVDATNGNDDNNGHRISTPKKTIKSALAAINSDATFGNGSTILLAPGIYKETAPLDIEKADVSIIGASVRNTIVHPTQATETNSLFRVNSGSYLANMTFTGVKASGTRGDTGSLWTDSEYGLPPTQGWNVSFYPDAKIFKSPYIQNCTNFSDSEIDNDALDFYTGDSDRGQAGDLDSAPTGGGLLVNGDTVHDDSPLRSMVADSYTHVGLDGPGIFVTNNGYAQVTSSYAFFNHFHIGCINGGQANLAASTTDFGRFSLVASGRSPSAIFTATVNGEAASGSTTFDIDNVTAAADWFGNTERPADNMLVDVGGNTYPILSATAIAGGWRVEISRPNTNDRTQNLGLNGSVADNAAVSFFLRSMIASSGHTMEYVGAGTDYRALPYNATGTYTVGAGTQPNGVPIEAHQVKELNNGKVWAAITDHNGTFKVGDTFKVNQQTGFVDIPAGALSVGKLLSTLDVNNNTIQNNSGANVNINDNLRVQNGNTLLLGDDDDSHAIGLTAPATVTADLTYTLPGADGNPGEVLSTDGSGTLSWASSAVVVDQIIEGNTKVEASDSGSDGTVTVTTDGTVAMTYSNTQQVDVTSAGTEELPSLVLASDVNTGVSHPADDTLAVSAGGVERVRVGTAETVINEGGNDHDFRVEGDNVTNLFQVDAGTDSVNINGNTTVSAPATVNINTNSVERAEFGATEVVFNDGGEDYDFRVEGDTVDNLFVVDASADAIDINGATTVTGSVTIDGSGDLHVGNNALIVGSTGTAAFTAVSVSDNGLAEVALLNTDTEDADGGRDSAVTFSGTQSGSEVSMLADIVASHDGTADDEAGQLVISTNSGADGNTPTAAVTIDSNQDVTLSHDLTVINNTITPQINGYNQTAAGEGGLWNRKNFFDNGEFLVDQRGSTAWFADRWAWGGPGFVEGVAVKQRVANSAVDLPPGFTTAAGATCTAVETTQGNGRLLYFWQDIEAVNLASLQPGTADARSFTLSFWVRSNKAGNYGVSIWKNNDGTNQRIRGATFNISAAEATANEFVHRSITFEGDTNAAGAFAFNENRGFRVNFILEAGSDWLTDLSSWQNYVDANQNFVDDGHDVNFTDSTSNNILFTGMQLELGDVATPYEFRQWDDELKTCMRYFESLNGVVYATSPYTGYTSYVTWQFKERKRQIPTFSLNTNGTVYAGAADTVSAYRTSLNAYITSVSTADAETDWI